MKMILIGFLLFSSLSETSVLQSVRDKFPYIENLKEINNYLIKLENQNSLEEKAYCASLYLLKAKYVFFPFSKYSNFKKGKQLLDKVISENQNNIEFRYLRFLFQNEIPQFLNYHSNMDEDFNFIDVNLIKSELPLKFKLKILNVLTSISNLKIEQKNKFDLLKLKLTESKNNLK